MVGIHPLSVRQSFDPGLVERFGVHAQVIESSHGSTEGIAVEAHGGLPRLRVDVQSCEDESWMVPGRRFVG